MEDEVTLVHRGRSGPELFPQAQHLIADRNAELNTAIAAAGGQHWDLAIDTSGYFPCQVRLAATALTARVGRYVFISSISVYSDLAVPGADESAATKVLDDPSVEVVTGDTYGGLKRRCSSLTCAT